MRTLLPVAAAASLATAFLLWDELPEPAFLALVGFALASAPAILLLERRARSGQRSRHGEKQD